MFSNFRKGLQDVVGSAITSSKLLREYQQEELISQEGPHKFWKIYKGTSKKQATQGKKVCIWILDKRLQQKGFVSNRCWENFIEIQKKGCNSMARVKHPGVLRVLEPLEENRSHLVMVTEVVLGSLESLLPSSDSNNSQEELPFSPLELKNGLMHLTNTLRFLHNEANAVHCDVSPGSVYVTPEGDWRLAGFVHVKSLKANHQAFILPETGDAHVRNEAALEKPCLGYMAPEIVTSGASHSAHESSSGDYLTTKADVFSFGALIFRVYEETDLIEAGDFIEYKSKLAGIVGRKFNKIPMQIQGVVRQMLSNIPGSRPSMSDFSGNAFFSQDVQLRALVFIESIVQADLPTKAAFFKDLGTFWKNFQHRVVVKKILPVVMIEVGTPQIQPIVIPLVMQIIPTLSQTVFMEQCLPELTGVMLSSQGAVLLGFVQGASIMGSLMTAEAKEGVLIPLLQVCWAGTDGAAHEEALKQFEALQGDIGYQVLKSAVMPSLHDVCQRTDRAKVRSLCLRVMKQLVSRTDKEEAEKMVLTIRQITKADRTPGTLQGVSDVCEAIGKQWGADIMANVLLPLLIPLLLSDTLNKDQLSKQFTLVKDLLHKVEEKGMAMAKQTTVLSPTQTNKSGTSEIVDWQQTAVPAGASWTNNAEHNQFPGNTPNQALPEDVFAQAMRNSNAVNPLPINVVTNSSNSNLMFSNTKNIASPSPISNQNPIDLDMFSGMQTKQSERSPQQPVSLPSTADQFVNVLSDEGDLFKTPGWQDPSLDFSATPKIGQQQSWQASVNMSQNVAGSGAGIFDGMSFSSTPNQSTHNQADPFSNLTVTNAAPTSNYAPTPTPNMFSGADLNFSTNVQFQQKESIANNNFGNMFQNLSSPASTPNAQNAFSSISQDAFYTPNQQQQVNSQQMDYGGIDQFANLSLNNNANFQSRPQQKQNAQSNQKSVDPFTMFAMGDSTSTTSNSNNQNSLI